MTPGQHHTIPVGNQSALRRSIQGSCRVLYSSDVGRRVSRVPWMPGSEGPSWRSNLGSLSQTGTRSLHLGVPLESSAPLQDGDPQTTPAEGAPPGCVSESPGRLLPHYIFLGPTSRNAGSVGPGCCLGICVFKSCPRDCNICIWQGVKPLP